MTLPASGALSLNAIHIEAGGSSGTQASINDADIRALIGKASGVQMSFSEWYGASSSLDTQTVTVGSYSVTEGAGYGFSNGVMGSIADNTSNIFGGSAFNELAWIWEYPVPPYFEGAQYLSLYIFGSHANSGFTTLKIGSYTFNRADAEYTNYGSQTAWRWNTTTNPFGTTNGAAVQCVFN